MKKLGFGFMRLPMLNENDVDIPQTQKMVDHFMAEGFCYFDTAHGYIGGKSEVALRECLTSKYSRDTYILANKLSVNHFEKEEDIRPLFESQLQICGVEYFDYYLMHAQSAGSFVKYKKCCAYETALELKAEGKIRHFGISFHDKAKVLDQILTEYPQIEVVQIQLNYLDYEDPSIESRKCLEVCRSHGKPVIVMEPVKGGHLAVLPEDAQQVLEKQGGGSNASYAIRFAAGQEGVMMVLSGMSDLAMVEDNCGYMKDFQPLSKEEQNAVETVCAIFRSKGFIPCTRCRYCVDGCPQQINIPALFSCMNTKKQFNSWSADYYYSLHTKQGGKASACVECGACEQICPQGLQIRKLLKDVAAEFEKE